MAFDSLQAILGIVIDASGAKKGADEVTESVNKMKGSIGSSEAGFTRFSDKAQYSFGKLGKDAKKTTDSVKSSIGSMKEGVDTSGLSFFKFADDAKVSLDDLGKKTKKSTALTKISFEDLGKTAKDTGTKVTASVNKVKESTSSYGSSFSKFTSKLKSSFTGLGKTLSGFGKNITGSVGSAVAKLKAAFGSSESASDKLKEATKKTANEITGGKGLLPTLGRLAGKFVVVAAAMLAFKKAVDLAKQTAEFKKFGIVMDVVGRNAGHTKETLRALEGSIRALGFSMMDARKTTLLMSRAQIDFSKATDLVKVAQDAATVSNMDSSQALERMIRGIQSGQAETLRNMGLNVNFARSYDELATAMDTTSSALDEREKKLARTNAVLKAATGIEGAHESMLRVVGRGYISNAKLAEDMGRRIGEAFLPLYGAYKIEVSIGIVHKALKDLSSWIESHQGVFESVGESLRNGFLHFFDAVSDIKHVSKGIVLGFAGDYEGAWKEMGAAWDTLTEKQGAYARAVKRDMTVMMPQKLQQTSPGVNAWGPSKEVVARTKEQLAINQKTAKKLEEERAFQASIVGIINSKTDAIRSQYTSQKQNLDEQLASAKAITAEDRLSYALTKGKSKEIGKLTTYTKEQLQAQAAFIQVQVDAQSAALQTADKGSPDYNQQVLALDSLVQALAGVYAKLNLLSGAKKMMDDLLGKQRDIDAVNFKKSLRGVTNEIANVGKSSIEAAASQASLDYYFKADHAKNSAEDWKKRGDAMAWATKKREALTLAEQYAEGVTAKGIELQLRDIEIIDRVVKANEMWGSTIRDRVIRSLFDLNRPIDDYLKRMEELDVAAKQGVFSEEELVRARKESAASIFGVSDPLNEYKMRLEQLKEGLDAGAYSQQKFNDEVNSAKATYFGATDSLTKFNAALHKVNEMQGDASFTAKEVENAQYGVVKAFGVTDPLTEYNDRMATLRAIMKEFPQYSEALSAKMRDTTDTFVQQKEALVQLSYVQKEQLDLQQSLIDLEQSKLNAASDNHRIGVISYMREADKLTRGRINLLQKELGMMDQSTAAGKIRANQLKAQIADLEVQYGEFENYINDSVASSFEGFFNDLASGSKSFKEAFHDMSMSILNDITSMVSKDLANELYNSLFGSGGGFGGMLSGIMGGTSGYSFSGGGGGGGLIGGVLDKLGFAAGSSASLAPMIDTSTFAAAQMDFGGTLSNGVDLFSGFANGGEFTVGGSGGLDSQLVAFKATPGERVSVNNTGQGMGDNGKATLSVNNYINVAAPQGNISRESMSQLQTRLGQSMRRAMERNT